MEISVVFAIFFSFLFSGDAVCHGWRTIFHAVLDTMGLRSVYSVYLGSVTASATTTNKCA